MANFCVRMPCLIRMNLSGFAFYAAAESFRWKNFWSPFISLARLNLFLFIQFLVSAVDLGS